MPVFERGLFIGRLSRVEPEVLYELESVLTVLVDTELDVLPERFVEIDKVVFVLDDPGGEFHRFLRTTSRFCLVGGFHGRCLGGGAQSRRYP